MLRVLLGGHARNDMGALCPRVAQSLGPSGQTWVHQERPNLANSSEPEYMAHAVEWLADNPAVHIMSFCVPAGVLSDHLYRTSLIEMLRDCRVDPLRLCFSVPLDQALTAGESFLEVIAELRQSGILFAVHNVGLMANIDRFLKHRVIDAVIMDAEATNRLVWDQRERAFMASVNAFRRSWGAKNLAVSLSGQHQTLLESIGFDFLIP